MKISIGIPTCNRPVFLQEAINSCLNQSYSPSEILIGDDSRDDASKKIVDDIKKTTHIPLRYFKNSPPLGQADNVNALIKAVTGEKMVLLHDDDLLLEDALEKMKYCFENESGVDAVFGKQYIINEKGIVDAKQTENLNKYFFRTTAYAAKKLSSVEAGIVQQFPNDAYMIDAKVAKKVKYRRKEAIGNAGDFDFGFRLGVEGYNLFFLDEFTAKYRMTESSVARNGTDSGYQSFKIISETPIPDKKKYEKTIKTILTRKAPVAIMQAIKHGKKKEALIIFFGEYHRKKILSLGGAKRLLHLIK